MKNLLQTFLILRQNWGFKNYDELLQNETKKIVINVDSFISVPWGAGVA